MDTKDAGTPRGDGDGGPNSAESISDTRRAKKAAYMRAYRARHPELKAIRRDEMRRFRKFGPKT